MSVDFYVCECESASRISNDAFKELISELKRSGVVFSKVELKSPYFEGEWDSEFCQEILSVFRKVSDRLILRDSYWIDALPDIYEAIKEVARSRNYKVLKIG